MLGNPLTSGLSTMPLIRLALPLFFALLTGCVSLQPTLQATAKPEKSNAYIAGSFTRVSSGGFAFVLTNTDSGLDYAMPFGEDTTWPKDVADQLIMIQVPPGKYRITHWLTYGTLTKERSRLQPVTNKFVAAPFTLEQGSIIFLGSFSASTETSVSYPYTHTSWSIKPNPIKARDAHSALANTYPLFGDVPFSCTVCIDSVLENLLRDAKPVSPPAEPAPSASPPAAAP